MSSFTSRRVRPSFASLVTLSLLAACATEGVNSPDTPDAPVAAVYAQSHEPTGMTPIASQPLSGATVTGWGSSYPAGLQWMNDATAPITGPSLGRITYPAGFQAGRAPITTNSANFNAAGYQELYVRFSARVSSNFYGHSSATNKVIHLWTYTPQKNKIFLSFEGKAAGALALQVRGQGTANDQLYGHMKANTGASAAIKRGSWQVFELRVRLNTPGKANGIVQAWVDGAQTHNYSNIQIDADQWKNIQLSPTWGGTGGTVPATMTMDVDDIYVSGRR